MRPADPRQAVEVRGRCFDGEERFTRVFAMPNSATFELLPVRKLLARHVAGPLIVDPFARNSKVGTYTNDIDPASTAESHMDAIEWLDKLIADKVLADSVLLDPPYSPRQMAESYAHASGRVKGMQSTQNERLYRECIERLDAILKLGGVAIRCGWNSMGFPAERYRRLETMLVMHGSGHNDTIVTADTKIQGSML
jgi:hypothetical protein